MKEPTFAEIAECVTHNWISDHCIESIALSTGEHMCIACMVQGEDLDLFSCIYGPHGTPSLSLSKGD